MGGDVDGVRIRLEQIDLSTAHAAYRVGVAIYRRCTQSSERTSAAGACELGSACKHVALWIGMGLLAWGSTT